MFSYCLTGNASTNVKMTLSYVGNFENDVISGFGTMTWTNGKKYVGEFENGFENGNGIYYNADGTKI